MGYRYRLGKVSKSDYMSTYEWRGEKECVALHTDEFGCVDLYEPRGYHPLFVIGGENIGGLKSGELKDFYNFDVKAYEYEVYVLTKEDLAKIILGFQQKAADYYRKLISDNDESRFIYDANQKRQALSNEWFDFLKWGTSGDGELTTSGMYEYSIFNLMYIYKTFDWEGDLLVYNAW